MAVSRCAGEAVSEPAPTATRGGRGARVSEIREQVIDIEHALAELAIARLEIAAVPPELERKDRERAMLEPMARAAGDEVPRGPALAQRLAQALGSLTCLSCNSIAYS
jgi:hypothetical protein